MLDNPCIKCSQAERKAMRDKHNVNSCKTVCEVYAPYEQQQLRRSTKIREEKERTFQAVNAVRDGIARREKIWEE